MFVKGYFHYMVIIKILLNINAKKVSNEVLFSYNHSMKLLTLFVT